MLKEKFGSAFSFLQASSPPLIGVDISSSALKLVELSETGKGAYRLERYAVEPLAKDVVADGNIANLDQVADALRRAHKRLGSRNRSVAAGKWPRPEYRSGRHRRACDALLRPAEQSDPVLARPGLWRQSAYARNSARLQSLAGGS